MVAIKFLVEIVVIVVALAVGLFWLYSNYTALADQFFGFLEEVPIFSSGG